MSEQDPKADSGNKGFQKKRCEFRVQGAAAGHQGGSAHKLRGESTKHQSKSQSLRAIKNRSLIAMTRQLKKKMS